MSRASDLAGSFDRDLEDHDRSPVGPPALEVVEGEPAADEDDPEPVGYGPIGEAAATIAEVGGLYAPSLYGVLLGALGTAVGFGPHVELGGAVHRANTWAVVVSPSGGGKGDTLSAVAKVVDALDPDLPRSGGIGSGPALIDEFYDEVPDPDKPSRMIYELVDDRRLLLQYDELSDLLGAVSSSAAHRLSENIRAAWDGIRLDARARAVGKRWVPGGQHVVGLLGAVTAADLCEGMLPRQLRNGFGGRIIWVPQPPMALRHPVPAARIAAAGSSLVEPLRRARAVRRVDYTREAFAWISATFTELAAKAAGDGVAEALTARWPAQTLRVGICLTAFDGVDRFTEERARAAGAYTRPCLEHAVELFGAGGEVTTARRAMAAESAPAGTAAAVSSDADRVLAKVAVDEFFTERELARRFGSAQRSTMDLSDALDKLARRGFVKVASEERGEERKIVRKGWRRVR